MEHNNQWAFHLLAAALWMTLCAVWASAMDDKVEVGGIGYSLHPETATATVVAKEGGYHGQLSIPETVTYQACQYTVTAIGPRACHNCGGLTQVNLPQTIQTIGQGAFYRCLGLEDIQIPDRTQKIGDGAFQGCLCLRTISFGPESSLTSIGYRCFYDCWRLCRVRLPRGLQTVGMEVFGQSPAVLVTEELPDPLPPSMLEDDVFEEGPGQEAASLDPAGPESPRESNSLSALDLRLMNPNQSRAAVRLAPLSSVGEACCSRSDSLASGASSPTIDGGISLRGEGTSPLLSALFGGIESTPAPQGLAPLCSGESWDAFFCTSVDSEASSATHDSSPYTISPEALSSSVPSLSEENVVTLDTQGQGDNRMEFDEDSALDGSFGTSSFASVSIDLSDGWGGSDSELPYGMEERAGANLGEESQEQPAAGEASDIDDSVAPPTPAPVPTSVEEGAASAAVEAGAAPDSAPTSVQVVEVEETSTTGWGLCSGLLANFFCSKN